MTQHIKVAKTYNEFASRLEQQAHPISTLSKHLVSHYNDCLKMTKHIKEILQDCLPKPILDTLLVGGYDNNVLTLATDNQTAVNHLYYQKSALQQILTKDSVTFSELKDIKILLEPTLAFPLKLEKSSTITPQQLSNPSKQSLENEGLSQRTRTNISYTAQHVIHHVRLKNALLKLADE